jgi:hypothetical protein
VSPDERGHSWSERGHSLGRRRYCHQSTSCSRQQLGDVLVLCNHVHCAPLIGGFVVCFANLKSEQPLPRLVLDRGQVCVRTRAFK